jgi:hypothetical protein
MNFVSWEPCHGKFFRGYPWAIYGDITDNLRYTVYSIIALDNCLRAEIQAPQILRDVFANEIREVGLEVRFTFCGLGLLWGLRFGVRGLSL